MNKLRSDESACGSVVDFEPMCDKCIRNVYLTDRVERRLYSNFTKTFKDGKLIDCKGYISKDK